MSIITRNDSVQQLPSGSDPLVEAIHLAATAPERHASRVEAAAQAARDYLTSSDDLPGGVTERMVGALLWIEDGGVGGKLGIYGDATRRMTWCTHLGKGRRQATDGHAWTAAIHAAAEARCPARPGDATALQPADVTAILPAIRSSIPVSDLEWVIATALRHAYAERWDIALSTAWAEVARAAAARAEPDGSAGRLAERYGLQTLPQLYLGKAHLRAETVGEMIGRPEAELSAGRYEVGAVTIQLIRPDPIDVYAGSDDGWRVRVDTRDSSAALDIVRRASRWLEGEYERIEFASFAAQMLPHLADVDVDHQIPALLARWAADDERMAEMATVEPSRVSVACADRGCRLDHGHEGDHVPA